MWTALDAEQDRESVAAILLAMLTGARLGEIVQASWNQFDLEQGVWTKPSSHTKQKRTHRAPLTPRHSFASLLAGDGVSLLMIGKLLGHTQEKTTARYAHLADQPLRDAVARVGKLVGGGGS